VEERTTKKTERCGRELGNRQVSIPTTRAVSLFRSTSSLREYRQTGGRLEGDELGNE